MASHVTQQSHVTSKKRKIPEDHVSNTSKPRDSSNTSSNKRQRRDDTETRQSRSGESRDTHKSREIGVSRDTQSHDTQSRDTPALLTTIASLQAQLLGKDAEISHLRSELTKANHVITDLSAGSSSHVTLEAHKREIAATAKQLHAVYAEKVLTKIQKYKTRKEDQVMQLKQRISQLERALGDSRRENSELVLAVDEFIDLSKDVT